MDLGGIFASLMNVIGSPYHVLLLLIAVPAGIFFGLLLDLIRNGLPCLMRGDEDYVD